MVVIGSARENRIADNILKQVKVQLANFGDFEVTVADLKNLPMPLFNAPASPSSEDFRATDANVINWTRIIGETDAVLFLVAEYNHSLTAVLKNAIDWIYHEWSGKPVAFVGYGWVGGARAIKHLRDIMGSTISAKAMETEANLRFMKEIDLEGNIVDEEAANSAIKSVLYELGTSVRKGIPVTAEY